MTAEPSLDKCLAHAVLSEPYRWLGSPSPEFLCRFLIGVCDRVGITGEAVPKWRIYGPLQTPEFYLPIVAKTGNPGLAIMWPTAMEFLYFSLEDAVTELLKLMREFVARHGFDTTCLNADVGMTLPELLSSMAWRPAMHLGRDDGWYLRCYLAGMSEGGDWLKLPELPGLRQTICAIEEQSVKSYGSPFAAYRLYDVGTLLGWAGVQPVAKQWCQEP